MVVIVQVVFFILWGFDNVMLLNGWIINGMVYYLGLGNLVFVMKFDFFNDDLMIYIVFNLGVLIYDIVGNFFFGGIFIVQEFVDGIMWIVFYMYFGMIFGLGVYGFVIDVLQVIICYICFFYMNKVIGNVGIDNVVIVIGVVIFVQEINVVYNFVMVFIGNDVWFNILVGMQMMLNFMIENFGIVNILNILGVIVIGFVVVDYIGLVYFFIVVVNFSGMFSLIFMLFVVGSCDVVLIINSNDVDEVSYVINLNGIGGNYFIELIVQFMNFVFFVLCFFCIFGSYIVVIIVFDGYVVFVKEGLFIIGVFVDGIVLMCGDVVGDVKVVFVGINVGFVLYNIFGGKIYYFVVYFYNGQD